MEPPSSLISNASLIIEALVIAGSLMAVAVLSGAESSFISANKIRIRNLIEKGDRRAVAVQQILDQHDRLFSAVILSGNMFTILATSLGTVMAVDLFGSDYGIAIATVVMTFLTVVFGELTPKTFAVSFSDKVALFLARPMLVYIKLISPLIWVFHHSTAFILRIFGVHDMPRAPYVTEEEIKTMISIGEEEGAIEQDEREMLHRVFEFGDTEVSEVMVPRTDMVAVQADVSVTDLMKLVAEKGYSRYPVIKDSVDDVQGVLYLKDVFITMGQASVENLSVGNFMRDAYFVPETKMATELLDDMQKNKIHIAVVIDEYGGTAGLVTLEDIMEEIVGGLQDEFEEIESVRDVEIIDERTFILSGQSDIDEVNELTGLEMSTHDYNTIGGLVFGLFGRLPKVGEQLKTNYAKFLVMDMEGRKVTKVKLTKLS